MNYRIVLKDYKKGDPEYFPEVQDLSWRPLGIFPKLAQAKSRIDQFRAENEGPEIRYIEYP